MFVRSPALLAILAAVSSVVFAADSIPFRAGVDLRASLEGTVGVTWSDAPLRPALERLSQGQAFAFLLDRRVDPDEKIQFTVKDERLEVALLRLAAQQKLGMAVVGPVIYLGPPDVAARLPTAAALKRWEASQTGASAAPKFAVAKPLEWELYAEPREIIVGAAKAYQVKIANPELIPHDVWAAGRWPALNFADRMSLLLAGFELSFRFAPGPQTIELIPLPSAKEYTATHNYRGDPAKAVAAIQKLFPDLKPAREGTVFQITAPFEVQERIDRLLQGDKVRTVTTGPPKKLYSLKVEGQPAGAVAKTIAIDLGKELKYAPEIREKLQQRVTFTVKDATLDQLLAAALTPLGLKWKLGETEMEVVAEP